MNINLLRKIDYYTGPIVIKLLLLLRRLFFYHNGDNADPALKEIKKILVIKFLGMGTILLASPALKLLKKNIPAAEITILTLSANRQVCEMLPSMDKVIDLNMDNTMEFVMGFLKVLRYIREIEFDAIIDLEFFSNFSAIITLLISLYSKRKITIGFNSHIKRRNSIYNINVSFDHSRHISLIFLKVVKCLCRNDDFLISFNEERASLLKYTDNEFIENMVKKNRLQKCHHFICININAGKISLHRRWPREYFSTIVRELVKKTETAVFLIGGKEDENYVSEFQKELSQSPRIVNLCGKTSIAQLMGLFCRSELLVTNDSGPLHLAQVMGLPSISFFGPETPHLYGPMGKDHHVFYQDMFCSPCLNIYNSKLSLCKRNDCLIAIKPETVLKVIEEKYLSCKS